MLIEIIYASAQSRPFSSLQLTELLTKARQNNQGLGVSGLLLYHRGSFLQVLEGDEAIVTRLYDKIAMDPRHKRCIVIKRGSIVERTFADWSMGFVEVSQGVASKLDGFNSFLQQGAFEGKGAADQVSKVLHGFRAGGWRQHVT